MAMLATFSDGADLALIMKEARLTSSGAKRLKDTGALAALVKIANQRPEDLLWFADLGLPLLWAFNEAGWTMSKINELVQDAPQLKQWLAEYRNAPQRGIHVIDSVTSIWKSISVGTIPRDQLGTKITELGMKVNKLAADMMKQKAFVVATAEVQVNFAKLSVADLGFKDGARYAAICARAIKRGYELCQPEDGPQLRIQYPDQPKGEWLRMAMEPIRDSDGDLSIFNVEHADDGLYLYSYYGKPDYFFIPGSPFVFRVPQEALRS